MTTELHPLQDLRPQHDVWTVGDLDTLPETNLIEVLDGALIVNPPPTVQHGWLCTLVATWLVDQVLPEWVVLVGAGVRLGEDGIIPDVCVVHTPVPDDTIWLDPSSVAVVVEVLSPSTRSRDLGRKRELYHQAGLTYVVVDPADQSVQVYDNDLVLDIDALGDRLRWD